MPASNEVVTHPLVEEEAYAAVRTDRVRLEEGARAIAASIEAALPPRPDEAMTITLANLHNHSHASGEEFAAMLERLSKLLNRAAGERAIHFTARPDPAAQYHVHGTAYLATMSGFDLWELFPRLLRADEPMMVWKPRQSILLLRQPRPNQPQILRWPEPD